MTDLQDRLKLIKQEADKLSKEMATLPVNQCVGAASFALLARMVCYLTRIVELHLTTGER